MSRTRDLMDVLGDALKKHGRGEEALGPVLEEIRIEGYTSKKSLQQVAKSLRLPKYLVYRAAAACEETKSQDSRQVVKVCCGTACHLAGSGAIVRSLGEELSSEPASRHFSERTLETGTCLGCCSMAPVVQIDGKVHGHLTVDTAKRVIKQHRRHDD